MSPAGIDVSANQGAFDWSAHKDIAFAGVRATSWQTATAFDADAYLKHNANTTWDVYSGKVSRWYYHETRTAATAPAVQADHFLSILGRHLCKGDVMAVAMGDNGGSGSMTPKAIAEWHGEFMHTLREMTERAHRVIAYCNPSWALAGNCQGLEGWGLWLADYGVSEPRVPAPWPKRKLVAWQTGGMELDRDLYMAGDRRHLNDWALMPAYRR